MSYYSGNSNPQPHRFDREMAFSVIFWVVLIGIVLATLIGGYMFIKPRYSVWSAQMEGEAEFAQAEGNRRIAILEAEAELEAAKALAAAEVERAKGVAEANAIIGQSLKDNEAYLRWQWIKNLESGSNSVIYVPTEAGLPILEAGKR
jgi:hypothetical protein